MRALLVARKALVELLREWQLLLLVLGIPVAFVAITALGYNVPLLATRPVLAHCPTGCTAPGSAALLDAFEGQRHANGQPVFEITSATDPAAAETALKTRSADALVTLAGDGSAITITGDAINPRFYRTSTIIEDVAVRHADRAAGRQPLVLMVEEPIAAAGPRTEFDLYTPGMIVFALLMIVPQTAMLVAREIRWRTLHRLRLTRLRAYEFLAGISLAQLVIAAGMVVLVLAASLAFGFNNRGSLGLAILVGLVVSFSAIGLGLVVACFVENDSQAINVGSTVTMIMVFFSGAMYQIPPLTILTLGGHPIDAFDVLPATHGFLALQQVLCYGLGLRQIAGRLAAALGLSLLTFAIGIAIFRKRQMAARAT